MHPPMLNPAMQPAPASPEGRAVYEALCALLGVPPTLLDTLDAGIRNLPPPCPNLRVELGWALEPTPGVVFDGTGTARTAGSRLRIGGNDPLPFVVAAPRIRVEFRGMRSDPGAPCSNSVELLAFVGHTAILPAFAGAVGVSHAVDGIASAIERAADPARRVQFTDPDKLAARSDAVAAADTAVKTLRVVAAHLRAPRVDYAAVLDLLRLSEPR